MESSSYVADILLVDDVSANLKILEDMLRADGHRTRSARTGEAALRAAESQPPDLVLLDVMMPEMDGYEVCRRLKANPDLASVPVIFLSALGEIEDKIEAFASGGVDYVTKPFQLDEVRARVTTHLRLHQLQVEVEEYSRGLESLVTEQVKEIADSQMATIFAMARLAESRDGEIGSHLERVRTFCMLLATHLAARDTHTGIDRVYIRHLVHASPLHDIGKVAVSDSILLKPGKLTAEEFEIMKTHTIAGAETLEAVQGQYPGNSFISMGAEIARSHHEKWDGTGYPDGLSESDIPLCARIMAVVDVYDALRSKRVYKSPIAHEESCSIIFEGRGSHFDPSVVDVFSELEDEFRRIFDETDS